MNHWGNFYEFSALAIWRQVPLNFHWIHGISWHLCDRKILLGDSDGLLLGEVLEIERVISNSLTLRLQLAICKRPPKKIKDLWTFKELPKFEKIPEFWGSFYVVFRVRELWQHAYFMFSVLENAPKNSGFTLLSLISKNLKNRQFVLFDVDY